MKDKVVLMVCLVASITFAEVLTLSDAELKAVTTSYEVRASHFNERSKEWEKRNAISNYLPQISMQSGFTRVDENTYNDANPRDPFGNFISPKKNLYKETFSHSVNIAQPITNGGVELIAIKIANETKQAIELEKLDLEQQVIYTTRKAYFDCITLIESIGALKADYAWTEKNLSIARIRYEGGGVPVTDVLQFESELTKKENDIAVMEANYQTALQALYHSIGIPLQKVNDSIVFQPVAVFESWYQKGRAALEWDKDSVLQLRVLNHYLNVTQRSKQVVFTKYLPSLNAFCNISAAQNGDFWKDDHATWRAGVTFNLTLFSGFRNSTKFKQADYDYKKAVVELEKSQNQIKMNIGRILKMYHVSYDGVVAARKQVELMEKQLQIMQQRYDGGQVNQFELLSVALAVRNTKIGYTQKLFECLLYETEFLRYTGKLEVSR